MLENKVVFHIFEPIRKVMLKGIYDTIDSNNKDALSCLMVLCSITKTYKKYDYGLRIKSLAEQSHTLVGVHGNFPQYPIATLRIDAGTHFIFLDSTFIFILRSFSVGSFNLIGLHSSS